MSWKIFNYNSDIDEGLKFGGAIAAFFIYIWQKIKAWNRIRFSDRSVQAIEQSINNLGSEIRNLSKTIHLMRKEDDDFRKQFRELNRVINDEREYHYQDVKDIKENITHLGMNLVSIEKTLEFYGMNPKKGV